MYEDYGSCFIETTSGCLKQFFKFHAIVQESTGVLIFINIYNINKYILYIYI